MTQPLRKVMGGNGPEDYEEGRNHAFRHTDRTSRWWDLTLECGHQVIRNVRYSKTRSPDLSYRAYSGRSSDDVLPAPTRVRCDQCPEECQP